MDETTRVVYVSAGQWCAGYRFDIRALVKACRDRCIWLVPDAIREARLRDVDLSDGLVDFYVTGGHKWPTPPSCAGS